MSRSILILQLKVVIPLSDNNRTLSDRFTDNETEINDPYIKRAEIQIHIF